MVGNGWSVVNFALQVHNSDLRRVAVLHWWLRSQQKVRSPSFSHDYDINIRTICCFSMIFHAQADHWCMCYTNALDEKTQWYIYICIWICSTNNWYSIVVEDGKIAFWAYFSLGFERNPCKHVSERPSHFPSRSFGCRYFSMASYLDEMNLRALWGLATCNMAGKLSALQEWHSD